MFIELTLDTASNRKTSLNILHIVEVRDNSYSGGCCITLNGKEGYVHVTESRDEIINLIYDEIEGILQEYGQR